MRSTGSAVIPTWQRRSNGSDSSVPIESYGAAVDCAAAKKILRMHAYGTVRTAEIRNERTLRPSPILECRLDAAPADPRKGLIGRALGAFGDVLAPGIRPDRID